ncbi:MAG: hypothetical protein GY820_31105 [Gammaproteobacteria bacterium]|nr:hypothetical protein [Gammaproteobacteria bacterium]
MIVEFFLLVLFLVAFWGLTYLLGRNIFFILWISLFVHLLIMGFGHNWAVQNHPTGLIFDLSVDAQKYYYASEALSEENFWSISPADITKQSGSVWHTGYFYLNIACMKLSSQPMLLIRLIKTFIFFMALALIAKAWLKYYDKPAVIVGIVYLSFGWWEILYYNFRNLRDGLIVSICILIYAMWQDVNINGTAGVRRQYTWSQYLLLIFCLILLTQTRVYMAAIIVGGIAIDLILAMKMKYLPRAFAITVVFVSLLIAFDLGDISQYALTLVHAGSTLQGVQGVIVGAGKMFFAPIPWQYSNKLLIPSQFMYLVMLCLAFWGLVKMKNIPWGELFIVVTLVGFLSIAVDSSHARKRMPLVPIFVGWMVAGLSRRRMNHSYRYVQLIDEPNRLIEQDK